MPDFFITFLQEFLVSISLPLWRTAWACKHGQSFQNPAGLSGLHRMPTLLQCLSIWSPGAFLRNRVLTGMYRVPYLCGELSGTKCPRNAARLLETASAGVGFSRCRYIRFYGCNWCRDGQWALVQFVELF